MRIAPGILETLCCPVTRKALEPMTGPELGRLNAAVAQGRARYAGDLPVTEALEDGLATADGSAYYRIESAVPVLLPDQRIMAGGDTGSADATRPMPPQADPWAIYWEKAAPHWNDLRPPRRPAPEDIALLERVARETPTGSGCVAPHALMLGVTPELATMRWPAGTQLLALDSSAAMIRHVWPAREAPDATVIRANWKAMPIRDGVLDIVVCDGGLAAQPYPASFDAVVGEVRRVLRDGGLLATRVFTRPDNREPIKAIFADLRAGRIGAVDHVRWRLVAALHGDRATGIRMGEIWDVWSANVPDPPALMESLGWPRDAGRVMENLRGGEAVLIFPTLRELRQDLSEAFEEIACEFPAYEDGERYPTLVLRPRPRSSGGART